MKLILDVIDNVVRRVQRVEDSVINNVTTQSPYYHDNDMGNGYAVSLRKKDLLIAKGRNVNILVLPDGDIGAYYGKWYDQNTGVFSIIQDSNEDREKMNAFSQAKYRIKSEDANLYPDAVQMEEIKNVLGNAMYLTGLDKILKYEELSDVEKTFMESKLDQLSVQTRYILINQIANNINIGVDRMSIVEQWWGKLFGTPYELKARSAIAAAYVVCRNYKKAVSIYDAVMVSLSLSEPQKEEIRSKITDIGRGEELFDVAFDCYQKAKGTIHTLEEAGRLMYDEQGAAKTLAEHDTINGKYAAVLKKNREQSVAWCNQALTQLDSFDRIASGLCKVDIGPRVEVLRAKCNGRIGRILNKQELIDKASTMLNNPKAEKF